MRCQWEAYIKLLPGWLHEPVDKLGKETLTELRLRVGHPAQIVQHSRSLWLERIVRPEDIDFCINTASHYSPWAAKTAGKGFITAEGGHRIGICGDAVIKNGQWSGFRKITSLCIRVARDIPDLAYNLRDTSGSTLIIGPPGSGKTTLLRDFIRQRSRYSGQSIAVLDERGELFPMSNNVSAFPPGPTTDILTGCTKQVGIDSLIRCMGPSVIVLDEITAAEDCIALMHAAWCGVELLATAHAGSKQDLYMRSVYRPLVESKLFQNLIILRPDRTWTLERINA